jgi:hypothetical protein
MRGLFAFSYLLLWGLIVLQAFLLREVLLKTVKYKRLLTTAKRNTKAEEISLLRKGTPIPEFTAPLVDTTGFLTNSQFQGRRTILFFVSTLEHSPLYQMLAPAIHAMWHKVEGQVYIICRGTAKSCRQLVNQHLFPDVTEDQIPVALDSDGEITASFRIQNTPQAIELDAKSRVLRYGSPEPGSLISDEKSNGHHHDHYEHDHHDHIGPTDVKPDVSSVSSTKEDNPPKVATTIRHSRTQSNGQPCDWPDDQPETGAAFARMDTTVSCVMTRFRVRSAWSLIPFYLKFRRVRRASMNVDGLLKAVFLIENLHTCYTMSLWKNDCAIVEFGSIYAHVAAANSAFGPTWRSDLKRAEIWSAQFRLWAVSAHNLSWEGLDLQTVLADQWHKRAYVARGDHLKQEETVNA